jgi:hypothetical protein
MGRRQKIVPNLLDIDDGALWVRKLHGVFVKSCRPNLRTIAASATHRVADIVVPDSGGKISSLGLCAAAV